MSLPPDQRVGAEAVKQTELLQRLAEAQECANLMQYVETLKKLHDINPANVDMDHVDMVTKKLGKMFEKVLLRA